MFYDSLYKSQSYGPVDFTGLRDSLIIRQTIFSDRFWENKKIWAFYKKKYAGLNIISKKIIEDYQRKHIWGTEMYFSFQSSGFLKTSDNA